MKICINKKEAELILRLVKVNSRMYRSQTHRENGDARQAMERKAHDSELCLSNLESQLSRQGV